MSNPNRIGIIDFSTRNDQQSWVSIDDRIMGGASQSHAEITTSGSLRFYGIVSLENQGGFASVRSPAGNYDLSGHSGLLLRVKGDGKRYKLGLRIDLFYDGVSYLSGFEAPSGPGEEIFLPFDSFVPTHHGQILSNAAPLDTGQIRSFVLLISEQQAGPFDMALEWIKAI